MDPIGGTSELEICRFERAGRTGEVEHLKPWGNVEADRMHGRIIGKLTFRPYSQAVRVVHREDSMTQPISVVIPVYDGVTRSTSPVRTSFSRAEVLEAVNARTAAAFAERRVRIDAWAAAHRVGQHA